MNVSVDGRVVEITSGDRVLWPELGLTKLDLVRYVAEMGDVLLRHLRNHPLTLHRFPEGVHGPHFFQTRAPAHPPWVRAVTMRTPRAGKVFDVVVLDDQASLVWAANISAIELHPYLGFADDFDRPWCAVFDLDPGAPADLTTCCDVALVVRRRLDALGVRSWAKVSGVKGLHVHVPVDRSVGFAATKAFVRAVAGDVAADLPDTVVTTMARSRRAGKVFIDWSQNDAWKSIITPYSLRGLLVPTVAAPVTWDEIERVTITRDARPLRFTWRDMPGRLQRDGDLFAEALDVAQRLPELRSDSTSRK
jgi:bifunctional non-homologous end joining protein LigD